MRRRRGGKERTRLLVCPRWVRDGLQRRMWRPRPAVGRKREAPRQFRKEAAPPLDQPPRYECLWVAKTHGIRAQPIPSSSKSLTSKAVLARLCLHFMLPQTEGGGSSRRMRLLKRQHNARRGSRSFAKMLGAPLVTGPNTLRMHQRTAAAPSSALGMGPRRRWPLSRGRGRGRGVCTEEAGRRLQTRNWQAFWALIRAMWRPNRSRRLQDCRSKSKSKSRSSRSSSRRSRSRRRRRRHKRPGWGACPRLLHIFHGWALIRRVAVGGGVFGRV
mmetsp:Transcript_3962/g.9194  ORF Transcript_3962/g.9194 Transcript_3962/m.9194 type:complete len:272 (-) Transcript_3962:4-819(-)